MLSFLLLSFSWSCAMPQSDAQEIVARALQAWRRDAAPGGAVAVVLEGELAALECFGLADLATGRANAADTPFYVASLAKPFTAACAVHAASRGKLDLDAPLTTLFPELPQACAPATLRHALHHRSGLLDVYDTSIAADLGRAPVRSNAAALELLARLPQLCFAPGTRMLYSNSGYVLLAEAIARSTGSDLAAYAREHLFGPAGMDHARYLGEPGLEGAAKSYTTDGTEWVELEVRTGLRGPGGLYLSLDDLVAFERAWLAGTWGTPELRAELLQAPDGWQHPRLGPYAAGWMLQELDGHRVVRHSGGGFGYSADLLRLPDLGLSVIALSNAGDLDAQTLATGIARELLPEVAGSARAEPREAVQLSAEQRARFGQLWRDTTSGEIWVLRPRADHFVIAALGDIQLELVAESATRLVARNAQAPFAVELDGLELYVHWNDGSMACLAPAGDSSALPPMEVYAGEYVHAGLGATIRLEACKEGLALVQHEPLLEVPPFVPVGVDQFVCEKGARIDFVRGGDGHVRGLVMTVNRAWNLRFECREGEAKAGAR